MDFFLFNSLFIFIIFSWRRVGVSHEGVLPPHHTHAPDGRYLIILKRVYIFEYSLTGQPWGICVAASGQSQHRHGRTRACQIQAILIKLIRIQPESGRKAKNKNELIGDDMEDDM